MDALERRDCPAALLSMALEQAVVLEGEAVVCTLRLSEPARAVERVFVTTANGTATYGTDYFAPTSQQVIFAPGQSLQRVTIATLKDAGRPVPEGNETFRITATPVTPALGTRALVATIADYQPPPTISVADVTVAEGNSGSTTASFSVTLSSTYPRPVTVNYATRDLTATVAGQDYVAASGTLTFAPGETMKAVPVFVTGDQLQEPTERFQFILSSPTNASIARGTATGTITNDEIDAAGFQITLKFATTQSGSVSTAVQQIAAEAAQRWSRVIIGDLPSVTLADGTFIDDFEMTVQMGLLDDQDGTDPILLANASPTAYRTPAPGLPSRGTAGLDPRDFTGTPTLARRFYLLDVITHEMGHALGFGAGFEPFDPLVSGDTFTGANALSRYRQVFGSSATAVPLEAGDDAHWRETTFGTELMSPTAAPVGTRNYISTITIGALQDMGYTVNYAAAENYFPPLAAIAGNALAVTPALRSGATRTVAAPAAFRAPAPGQAFAALAADRGAAAGGTGAARSIARTLRPNSVQAVFATASLRAMPARPW